MGAVRSALVIPLDLRPLGIGEIFDRAVTLFVRHFAVFVLILAVVSVPLAIVAYTVDPAGPDATGLAAITKRIVTLPAASAQEQRAVLRDLLGYRSVGPRDIEFALASAILGLLSTTACVIAVAQASAGERPSARGVYREALRRFPALLAASVVFAGLVFVAIVAFAGLFIIVLVVSLPFIAIGAATIAIGLASLAVALAVLFEMSMLNFMLQMMIVSIALDEKQPMRGIMNGLRRTLSPPVLWRSILVATIALVVSGAGSLMLFGIASSLSSITHVAALSQVISAIGDPALAALTTAFVVMYTFDVRARREGYDLAIAAQEAAP